MGNGLAGCSDQPLNTANLQSMNMVNLGKCSVCPANLYQSCSNALGSEWDFNNSQSEGVGCKAVCKRIAYTNTDGSCCWGQQNPDQRITCDPSLTPGNPKCAAPIINYCSQEGNINSAFCLGIPEELRLQALNSYCNSDNIQSKSICKNFVASGVMGGKIDDKMSTYCNKYPNDDLCCFMTSKIPCPNKFDSRCFNKAAYQTYAMLGTKCPDVLNCNMYANLDSNSKLFASNVQLNCGTKEHHIITPTLLPSYLTLSPLLILIIVSILYSFNLYKVYHGKSKYTSRV